MFIQRVAHFGNGANFVVRHGVHNQSHTAYAITFIANFFVIDAFEVAGGFVNIALDGVSWQIDRLGFFNSHAQAWVGVQISTTQACSHHDFANHTGPNFATLFVLTTLAMLDICPFAVTSHA
jgi:hypothetical protein